MKLAFGESLVDLDSLEVTGPAGPGTLSALEASLLRYLADRPGEVVSQAELHEQVWGYAPTVVSRAAYHAIVRLRRRLEQDPSQPVFLVAVRGAGFRLDAEIRTPAEAPAPPLPRLRTRFFGRLQERALLREHLLERRTCVVSLVGMGGIGKTSLALEVAWDVARAFRQVVFCDLSQTTHVDEAASRLLRDLGIRGPGMSWRRVTEALRTHGPTLLILDNVEQLLPHLALPVSDLVDACPDLQVLATGRTDLRIRGELRVLLEALVPPDLEAPVADVADNLAVQLFADRMALHEPRFSVTERNAPAVVTVVRQLGGWPLALELAAAQCVGRGIEWLVRDLPLGVDLQARAHDVPDRHRTMDATLAWSWELLDDAQRDALLAFGCLPGGVSSSAQQRVVDENGPLLARTLHERGWLYVVSDTEPGPRYGLLPPVRAWVQRQHPRTSPAWIAVVGWAQALAQQGTTTASKARGTPHLDMLEAERDNLEAAFDAAMALEDVRAVADVALAIGLVAWNYGPHPPALARLRLALRANPDRADLHHRAGLLASTHEPTPVALALLQRAAELALAQGLERQRPTYLQHLARLVQRDGDVARADQLFEEALALAEPRSREELAVLGTWCGSLAEREDPRAVAMGERAAALCARHEDRAVEPGILHNLAKAYLRTGELERARETASLAHDRAVEQKHSIQGLTRVLLAETWAEEAPDRARELLVEAVAWAERVGDWTVRDRAQAGLASLRG